MDFVLPPLFGMTGGLRTILHATREQFEQVYPFNYDMMLDVAKAVPIPPLSPSPPPPPLQNTTAAAKEDDNSALNISIERTRKQADQVLKQLQESHQTLPPDQPP
jgi:hypothetical protein